MMSDVEAAVCGYIFPVLFFTLSLCLSLCPAWMVETKGTGKAEQAGKNRGISPYTVPSFYLRDGGDENSGQWVQGSGNWKSQTCVRQEHPLWLVVTFRLALVAQITARSGLEHITPVYDPNHCAMPWSCGLWTTFSSILGKKKYS